MCFRPPTVSKPKKCPNCGMPNPAIAKVCFKCKTELPKNQIACPSCGKMNDDSALECVHCGFTGE